MRERVTGALEWLLNIASVALLAFVAAGLAPPYFGSKPAEGAESVLKGGDVVAMPDVDWRARRRTLVFALTTGCRYCGESAPFYRALLAAGSNSGWQAVAALPQSAEAAATYMQSMGYGIATVRQVDLAALKVTRTPTLILVDDRGRVLQQWIGLLSPAEEADVARHLGLPHWRRDRSASAAAGAAGPLYGERSPIVSSEELIAMLRRGDRINLLDVRDRARFSSGRIGGAMNIPDDELPIRAPHELWLDAPTVVYCRFQPACADSGIPSLCSRAAESLRRGGVANVRVVRDSLPLLAEAGVPIVGSPSE